MESYALFAYIKSDLVNKDMTWHPAQHRARLRALVPKNCITGIIDSIGVPETYCMNDL